jgi:hypothetical protein
VFAVQYFSKISPRLAGPPVARPTGVLPGSVSTATVDGG